MRSILAAASFALAVVSSTACVHNTMWTVAGPTLEEQQGAPVRIKIAEIYSQGGHLWIESEVINGTDDPLVVDRDVIALVFPDGGRMSRRKSYGKATIAVPPHATRGVNFDFDDERIDWPRLPSVTIDFGPSVARAQDGAPVPLPKIVAHP